MTKRHDNNAAHLAGRQAYAVHARSCRYQGEQTIKFTTGEIGLMKQTTETWPASKKEHFVNGWDKAKEEDVAGTQGSSITAEDGRPQTGRLVNPTKADSEGQ